MYEATRQGSAGDKMALCLMLSGNITVASDVNSLYYSSDSTQINILIKNLIDATHENRAMAAIGVNPNESTLSITGRRGHPLTFIGDRNGPNTITRCDASGNVIGNVLSISIDAIGENGNYVMSGKDDIDKTIEAPDIEETVKAYLNQNTIKGNDADDTTDTPAQPVINFVKDSTVSEHPIINLIISNGTVGGSNAPNRTRTASLALLPTRLLLQRPHLI